MQDFADGAPSLIDGGIRFRASPRIGIGDRDLSEAFSPEHPGLLSFLPLRVKERVVGPGFVRIAVGPTVDGDSFDVPRGIEARTAKHSRELIADISVEL